MTSLPGPSPSSPPKKRILTPTHLTHFLKSQPHRQIRDFILSLNDSVQGISLKTTREHDEHDRSEGTIAVLKILDLIYQLAEETPPIPNPKSRFGNPAFRTFHEKLVKISPELHSHLPNLSDVYTIELSAYLTTSFGNEQRIDYGSGMEINFLCWLYCLNHLGIFNVEVFPHPEVETGTSSSTSAPTSTPKSTESQAPSSVPPPPLSTTTTTTASTTLVPTLPKSSSPPTVPPPPALSRRTNDDNSKPPPQKTRDAEHMVNLIFQRYLELMRYLQKTYWLEPAGSQGAFGLDDYQVLPFLFGATQLVGHKYITPKAVRDKELVEEYGKDFMYLGCIQFINSIKTGASLRWHSPLLDDLTAVKSWSKISTGMIKLFSDQVLAKLPVAQHFYFGSIWSWDGPLDLDNDIDIDEEGGGSGEGLATDWKDGARRDEHGHVHVKGEVEGLGDCCGIRVPGVWGALAEGQQHPPLPQEGLNGGGRIRRVPFD